MCPCAFGGSAWKRIKFVRRGLVDKEAGDMGGNVMLFSFVSGDEEVQQVAFRAEIVRGRVPVREKKGFHGLRSRVLRGWQ